MSDYALEARGLTKTFGGFHAVKDVNLKVRRGSIHALIGPNGAGKTTCFNLLTKTLTPTAGQVLLDGQDITKLRSAQVAKLGLVRSFQISATFPHLTCLENVRVALQSNNGTAFQFWRSLKAVEPLNQRARELLAQVGLAGREETPATELSYGKKRALEIATTLALDPKVMLLDEPTAGMGHEDVEPITDLIRKVSAGRTILIVEHNLSVVSSLCERITVLQHGEVLTEGTYAEVSTDPEVITAYMGGVDD
ncbi:ABC transporter ATP-binding protein [Pararhodobacter aggregans]|uniref:ABC transporter ATP-binding protein n=1 Tax=Pararhodobacter aggregans TaxID=404875 RepID=A0A2T7USA9_9RHOB|nr:ABC transporter ATP-binding protein [Pararhodobacter aggregans]PTX00150.1 amino acid/amide ABC transporter ATP-binding protein 1 (HAAT family) [Pararhodobacter aggregans]PVE47478.1 ABC transporter ATP-binding protein [Pararhodobacter aggregans]